MADRKISELDALTTPAAGDYLPIVDISEAAAADKNKRITITSLLRGAPDGTAAAPSFAFESDDDNGMFRSGTNTVGFATAGSQRVTIDSSGRLLVGTTSASVTATAVLQNNSANSGPSILRMANSSATPADGANLGILAFTDSTQGTAASVEAERDGGTWSESSRPSRLTFNTTANGSSTNTERMRIKENGQVLISGSTTTSAAYAFQANDSGSNALFSLRNDGYISTGSRAVSPYNNTTASAANMYVFSDGGLYRSTSSIRFKTDVETLQPQYADALLNCRPVWYRSLCANDSKNWGYWGFIAEEVAEIDPRLVFWKTHETEKDEDGNTVQVELEEPIAEGVQYDRFVPHLLNLIKRQKEQIEAMEARLSGLEAS